MRSVATCYMLIHVDTVCTCKWLYGYLKSNLKITSPLEEVQKCICFRYKLK